MGPGLLSTMYEIPLIDAEELVALYFDLFPKIRDWQEMIKEKAAKTIWLRNVFGYEMAFWDIYKWNSQRYERLQKLYAKSQGFDPAGMRNRLNQNEKEWMSKIESHLAKGMKLDEAFSKLSYDLGEDAKSAISFLPRDTAAAMLKQRLLQLRLLAAQGILLSSTHDSMLTEVEESKVDWIANLLRETMEAPFPQLSSPSYPSGLIVNVEAKFGPNWGEDMEVYNFSKEMVAIST
jgi:DNA polymerase I-like protein with 3'-5' exonuclease and polymerase domains